MQPQGRVMGNEVLARFDEDGSGRRRSTASPGRASAPMQLDDAAGEALVSLALEIVHGLTALAYEGIQEGNTEDRKRGAMGLLHRRLVALVNVHRLVDGGEVVVPGKVLVARVEVSQPAVRASLGSWVASPGLRSTGRAAHRSR
jgi:hypothetical protein